MRQYILLFYLFILFNKLFGQVVTESISGQVSFVSSQNVYVKFNSTIGIAVGDTLFTTSNGTLTPALKVTNLSSTSCICTAISTGTFAVTDKINAKKKIPTEKPKEKVIETKTLDKSTQEVKTTPKEKPQDDELKQKIKGSISVNSMTDFSNTAVKNSQQFRYVFSMNADNISNSKFSFESYLSFRHKIGEWADVKNNVFNALKIYDLAVRFDPNKTTQISFGRKMNSRITSIGAMDGLQFDKTIHGFSFGAVVGSRPNYTDYGFNSKLFQYGAYVALNTKSENTFTESSLAFMDQMNGSKTDRRFLYFQHSNSLLKNVFFFSTFEVDLYKVKNNQPQNKASFASMYLSLRYRMTKRFTITGSYDARKNVIYWESFKSSIDSVLEKEKRQSYRLQANYLITKDLMFGLQGGYRSLKSDPHPSYNAYGYLTYYNIPGINISATISGTYLKSNYMIGEIYGVNISRELFKGKFQTDLGCRFLDYDLVLSALDIHQQVGDINVSWQISRFMSLSLNYEGTFQQKERYNRIYAQLRIRF
jgi:hypothetical protein